MGLSTNALAQEDVQARYEQLEKAVGTAKLNYQANPTGANLEIMNQALDTFRRYDQANRATLRKLSRRGAHETLDTGGPDDFGYTFIDSNEPGGPVFDFIDITPAGPAAAGKTAGVLIASGDEDIGVVPLGAPFDFYGTTYTTLGGSTNGYISTNPADSGGDFSNDCPLPATPSTGGGARLYPLHGDLISDVYYEYFSTCPYVRGGGGMPGDLEITKTVDNTAPAIGDTITYTLHVTNLGDEIVDGVRVRDILPDGVSFVSADGEGTYDPASGIWRIGTLTLGDGCSIFEWSPTTHFLAGGLWRQEAILFDDGDILYQIGAGNVSQGALTTTGIQNETAMVGLTVACNTFGSIPDNYAVLIEPPAPSGGVAASIDITVVVNTDGPVTNTALITSSTPTDPDQSNNEASVTINPVSADLSLTKTVTAFQVVDGVAHATYRVTVRNDGPNPASGVVVEDVGTDDMTLTGVSASQGTTSSPPIGPVLVSWAADTLSVGASATLDITVTAPEGGNLLNVAEVVSADQVDPDSTPDDGQGDDFAATIAGFRPDPDFVSGVGPGGIIDRGGRRFAADLSITKTVDGESVAPGQDVVYTITVNNAGPQSTAGVKVTDELPACLDFVSADASQGDYDADTGLWTVGKLRVGAADSLRITATVTADCDGEVTNTASISGSNLPDPDDIFTFFDEDEEDDSVAEATVSVSATAAKAQLLANYPNPFNPETVIPFELGAASKVSIKVYDLLGRLVQTLVDEDLGAGAYEVTFQGNQLSTGVYLVRMEAAGQIYTQRITLMK